MVGAASELTYDIFHTQICPAAQSEDTKTLHCSQNPSFFHSADQIAEDHFFQQGAGKQLLLDECEVSTLESQFVAHPKALASDFTSKLPLLRILSSKIAALESDLRSERALLSATGEGVPSTQMTDLYESSSKETLAQLKPLVALYKTITTSCALSLYPEGLKLIDRAIHSKLSPADINTEMLKANSKFSIAASATRQIQKLEVDIRQIQKAKTDDEPPRFQLNRASKEFLFRDGSPAEWLSPVEAQSPAAQSLMCRMNARYGEGVKDLDQAVFGGSLLLGGAGLLAKAGAAEKLFVLGLEGRVASLLPTATEVLMASSDLVATTSLVGDFNKKCLQKSPHFTVSGPTCEFSNSSTRLNEEQANCALGLALVLLPPALHANLSPEIAGGIKNLLSDLNKAAREVVTVGDNQVTFLDVALKDGRFKLSRSGIADKDAIYIGVSNHSGEGIGHFYLVAGNKRYDGRMLRSAKVKTYGQTAKDDQPTLTQGVLFKINVDAATVDKVAEGISKNAGKINYSCVHGLCEVLKNADIEIAGFEPGSKLKLQPILNGLIDGKVSVGPVSLEPGQVKMFATSQEQLEHFLKTSQDSGSKYIVYTAAESLAIAGVGAVGVKTTAAVGYIVYKVIVETVRPPKNEDD
jgi:hypothetical protein